MNDINTIWSYVEIQENGIIRNQKGYLIGRLRNDVEFSSKEVQETQFPVWRAGTGNQEIDIPSFVSITTRLNRLERMVILQGVTITLLVVTMMLATWG